MEENREKFSSGLAVFFATLSSCVGLGNIWMFPYVVGENGGATFILIYLACVLIIGLPTLISEFALGRQTRKNIYGAVSSITDKKMFRVIGIFGVTASFCMLFFYTVVTGWVYSYVFKALTGAFKGADAQQVATMFNQTSLGPISPILWQLLALVVGGVILTMGVKSGIEKLTKTLMPVLIVLLALCAIRSVSLPNAMGGIDFLFKPDFSKVTFSVFLSALGLAFFKLSVGTGSMVTYSSYFTDDNNLIATGAKVAVADTCVSLIAGIAIFPAVFSFGQTPASGPGLLFNTVPLIFSKMPGGTILAVVFFLLTAMAATMAMISIMEVLIATFSEQFKIGRVKAIIINIIIIIVFGSLASLSANPDAPLANVTIFGLTFFDFFNAIISNVLLPINGFLVTILMGHVISNKVYTSQLTNDGTLKNEKLVNFITFLVRYITPALILIVFVKSFI
ncbi:sodium-dependent transporter [Clostridium sardiniense]|uniref:Sodium-dependent transporter n=1 Tax=Clostridium sardiniense TaxID=29369 RepID=A0ABS7KZK2_CLOSR|nr:sodium-dependent transporter [Clostridium sardiniense]MBY0756239.1 sodium-dependent transporter [Clostridium sardiniense]MDQ0458817.1 NSS family neurotransmitter:Na+ symporter [Clostridium sardiniense]